MLDKELKEFRDNHPHCDFSDNEIRDYLQIKKEVAEEILLNWAREIVNS
jgi:hypothetical protein